MNAAPSNRHNASKTADIASQSGLRVLSDVASNVHHSARKLNSAASVPEVINSKNVLFVSKIRQTIKNR